MTVGMRSQTNIQFTNTHYDDTYRNRASVNTSMQPGGETALHLAAQRGLQTCLKILLDQPDADVDVKDMSGGRTPLFLAATNRHAECVRMLIENGYSLCW